MSVLVLDTMASIARTDRRPDEIACASFSNVQRSDVLLPGEFDQIIIVDHGDVGSLTLLRQALGYRRKNPDCELTFMRRLDPSWTETECLTRVSAVRRAQRMTLDEAQVIEVLSAQDGALVTVLPEHISIEFTC